MPTYDEIENRDIRDILGYLNFSSGNCDPRFFTAWNSLFSNLAQKGSQSVWTDAFLVLKEGLKSLSASNDAFRHSDKARQILDLVFQFVLPAYRKFHEDILFHQKNEFLFNSFFVARVHEIVLSRKTIDNTEQTISSIISELNDFLGYRPIPVLEGEEKHEPNPHEWIAPLPLFRADSGAAFGPYQILIQKTVKILNETNPRLLHDAWFDPEKLNEIVMDPRAFDFDHPVNRRPNYSFGTWDPHCIDEEGYYRRFVVHQITVDGMLQRVKNELVGSEDDPVLKDMLYFEAAAVFAGTMLMGSGISGDHVQAHDSTVSLSVLMPLIADYRDRFYEQLIKKVPSPLKERLEGEAARLFQPFGGSRQNLNKYLAKQRADQLQRFHLARTFARMGYFESAMNQTKIISVASARFLCQIDCYITESHLLADKKEYKNASDLLPRIEELLFRGIACGALPDPWSMLGFGGEYSLFSAVDNTVHDHRIDDLIGLMNDIFDLYSRIQKEAAVAGDSDLQADLSDRMSTLAGWWDQFGSTEVSNVEGFSGLEVWESATKVSNALAVWHKAGTAAGDVAFWSRHVDRFSSPKAFVLLCEALLEQNDLISSMALLMHWLAESERIPLQEGDYSFHSILVRWIQQLWKENSADQIQNGSLSNENKEEKERSNAKENGNAPSEILSEKDQLECWKLMIRFLDRLEANADRYWSVPTLDLDSSFFDKASGEFVRKPVLNSSFRKESAKPVSITLNPMNANKIQIEFRDFWKDYLKGAVSTIEELTRYVVEKLRKKSIPQNREGLKEIFRVVREKEIGKPISKKRENELDLFFDFWYDQIVNYIKPVDDSDLDSFSEDVVDSDIPRQELENTKNLADLFLKFDLAKDSSEDHDPSPDKSNIQFSDTQFIESLKKIFDFIENTLDDPKKKKNFLKNGNWLEIEPGELVKLEVKDDSLILEFLGDLEEYVDEDLFEDSEEDLEDDDEDLEDSEYFDDDFENDENFEEDLEGDFFDEDEEEESDPDEDDDELDNRRGIDSTYNAAYDNMSFEDSASDGVDDDMMESGAGFHDGDDFELNQEMERIQDRLAFIYSLVKLWKFAGGKALPLLKQKECEQDVQTHLQSWLRQCCIYKKDLDALLVRTSLYHVPKPSGTAESLMEYDQHRGTKEILLDRIVWSMVEVTDTILFLQAILGVCSDSGGLFSLLSLMEKLPERKTDLKLDPQKNSKGSIGVSCLEFNDLNQLKTQFLFGRPVDSRISFSISGMELPAQIKGGEKIESIEPVSFDNSDPLNEEIHKELEKYRAPIMVISAMFQGKVKEVRRLWPLLLTTLEKETLLYVPTSRGGSPRAIVACRCLQQVVLRLLEYAPRLGLLTETFQLLRTIQKMERVRPSMPGAITEFDRLFETATRSIASAITESSKKWRIRSDDPQFHSIDDALVLYIQKTTDILASCWLSHSQHIRISSVESLMSPAQWSGVKSFIISYGKDILTQHFLGFRNLRAILHQGADSWIRSLIHMKKENKTLEAADHLIEDVINNKIPYQSAVYYLELIFECIAENYSEYIDYNSTTTHSDHGEKTYMFLDMLRILTSYERIAWNLKPVYWIHDTMLRAKCLNAASLWEESVARRSAEISEGNLRNYKRLSEQYGIWLPSIHERLQERHVRPLQIAQMCALIAEAIDDIKNNRPSSAFKELEKRIEVFASTPMGIGFELPEWLNALQEEVLNIQTGIGKNDDEDAGDLILNPNPVFEQVRLSRGEIARQITYCMEQMNFGE